MNQATTLWTLERTVAARAVISDIEDCACAVRVDNAQWWDLRPMLDDREHPPQSIDMASQALIYAFARGLITRHPQQQHLVRINRPEWI